MKILSDFDGVVTDLTDETLRVRSLFESYLSDVCGQATALQALRTAKELVRANPHLHGWRSGGRISAFANEDGFIYVNGLAACLDELADNGSETPTKMRSEIKRLGFETFSALANHSYMTMTKETAESAIKPMDRGTGTVLKKILDRGHSIVIVSNSGTERIRNILQASEVRACLDSKDSMLTIRGNARKFVLGNSDDAITHNGYQVSVDRPSYRSILLEEAPDLVLGDVFSLDLALPLALSTRGELKNPGIYLRKRDYTPDWSIDFMGELTQGAKGGILENFDELLAIT